MSFTILPDPIGKALKTPLLFNLNQSKTRPRILLMCIPVVVAAIYLFFLMLKNRRKFCWSLPDCPQLRSPASWGPLGCFFEYLPNLFSLLFLLCIVYSSQTELWEGPCNLPVFLLLCFNSSAHSLCLKCSSFVNHCSSPFLKRPLNALSPSFQFLFLPCLSSSSWNSRWKIMSYITPFATLSITLGDR